MLMLNFILSVLIWFPILGALFLIMLQCLLPRTSVIKVLGLGISLLELGFCVFLWRHFDLQSGALQWTENFTWIKALNVHYALGVDGISLLFVLLSCFTNVIMILSAWRYIKGRAAEYMAVFLFATGISNGIFLATDGFLFYLFWEASMLPLYLGLGLWGMQRRAPAALKFFLFNLLGSLLMLIAFVFLYVKSNSFSFDAWMHLPLRTSLQGWIFLAFFIAFAVKTPMWPLHTWFADMSEQAPPGGSIILAALMLKLGMYGFLRFNLPLTPHIPSWLLFLVIILSLFAIVYVGIASIVQKDMKRLIAYSSISHMGIASLGIFMSLLIMVHSIVGPLSAHTAALMSVQGALFQVITHAFSSGALFIMAALLFDRFHSNQLDQMSGLASSMPIFAFFFVLFALANVGLPGTSGFVGEFLVVLAALKANFWVAVLAACTLVISPAYMLWWVKRSIFGEVKGGGSPQDLGFLDGVILLLLAVPVIGLGIYPAPLLDLSNAASAHLIDVINTRLGPVA